MPLLDKAAKWTTNKMPKVITPKAHAIIDYAMAASFFGMAAFFWRRNKRAAVSALVCGAAALCRRAGIPLLQNAGPRPRHSRRPYRLHRQRRRRTAGRTG